MLGQLPKVFSRNQLRCGLFMTLHLGFRCSKTDKPRGVGFEMTNSHFSPFEKWKKSRGVHVMVCVCVCLSVDVGFFRLPSNPLKSSHPFN